MFKKGVKRKIVVKISENPSLVDLKVQNPPPGQWWWLKNSRTVATNCFALVKS